jgi:hypothetical protein
MMENDALKLRWTQEVVLGIVGHVRHLVQWQCAFGGWLQAVMMAMCLC